MSSKQKKFYIEQRKPSGIYYYIVCDPVSHKTIAYKSTGTTDRKQAEAIGMEWWTNGIPGSKKTALDRKTIFCDYLSQFWDFEKSMYFRELETMGKVPHIEHALEMQKIVGRYYRSYFNSILLCQINGENLQEFIVYLKVERGLSSSTVNSARNAAFVALKYAKRKKMISQFDFDSVLRFAGGKAAKRGVLESEEVDKLFKVQWSSIRARIATFISYNTGMRIGEIRALRVCDIHNDRINVMHSWARLSKNKSTKNKEIRDVPILPAVYEEIMAYIKEMNFFNLNSLLIPGSNPEIPLDSHQIRDDFYRALEKIGIDKKTRKERNIVFHSWRHLFAKNFIEKGANKAIGMKILGQKTSQIFDDYADHADKETFRQMANAIKKVNEVETKKEPIAFKEVI